MFARKGRFATADCDHPTTMNLRNAGIERTVCEACGRVSIKPLEASLTPVDRTRFERTVERAR